MSKSIRSYPKSQQAEVVRRRLASKTKGLGYWAAMGWAEYVKKEAVKKEQRAA